MKLSLTAKLLLPIVLGMVLVSGAVLTFLSAMHTALEGQIRQMGQALPATLASSMVEIVATRQDAAVTSAIDDAVTASGASYIVVVDANGEEFAGAGPALESIRPRLGELTGETTTVQIGNEELLDFRADITGGALGSVHVGYSRTALNRDVRTLLWRMGLTLFAVIGLVVLLVAVYSRWLLSPLKDLTTAAVRIAKEGDLAQKIPVRSQDEVGQLALAFSSMVERLRELPVAMQAAVRDLANASAEIYSTAQEQEAAAQQQSSAVEEVSRTMQSLLEAATYISDSAQGVLTNAQRSKETSDLTASKIGELNGHAGRMGEILDVIREIANRSDLLALNASLEGTRAGEAGRGFSLVATEMRRLAERVMASVQDVKVLVTDVRASSTSTVLVTEEARKLAEATTNAARQIAQISQQQRSATEQVSRGMKDAAAVLGQSVSAARQTRSASENLNTQAVKLKDLVAGFRIDREEARAEEA